MPISLMGSMAEKVLENPKFPEEWPYSEKDFARMDESNDAVFYDSPRLVYHIDDAAVSALTKYYSENLKEGDDVLDICSSWVSHYPKDFKGGKVVGVGMNAYELSQNPQLKDYFVKDLNVETTLPFDDASFDKVTCVVSVDYLNKPLEIFKEIGRVLRPGGECIISMSNRCFPTKAFQVRKKDLHLKQVPCLGFFREILTLPHAVDVDLASNKRSRTYFHYRKLLSLRWIVRTSNMLRYFSESR